ncbi:MAG: gamma carbonic anhydrase family protein [Candidatus Binatia bacterium]|nr:MAG: gamma carbonic anhydrase family protein [Candidatus Binatia bacterium]
MVVSFEGKTPRLDLTAYVHRTAEIIGDVELGAESSVWPYAVIRGDVHYVRIGARTNLQDGSLIHVTTDRWPTIVGDEVTVGHRAVLHGCCIGPRCLIGIGAIVLDGAEIGEECIVGAGALVTPGTKIPAGHLVLGVPAKVIRPLSEVEKQANLQSALHYVAHAKRYRDGGIF